ncbi:hypothetical protein LDENG_00179600, partial [Lucifuga dentata]
TDCQSIAGLTQRQTNSFTPTGNLEFPIHLTCMSLEVGGSRSTRRDPMRTRGEHANSTQKGPAPASNQTHDLLAVRQQR